MSDGNSAGISRRKLLEAAGTAAAAAAVAAVGLPRPAAAAQAAPLSIGEAWVAFWNTADIGVATALFTDDVFYEDVPSGNTWHSLPALQVFARGFAASGNRFALANEFTQSDAKAGHACIEWVWTKPGGTKLRGVTAADLVEGKIARNSDYYR